MKYLKLIMFWKWSRRWRCHKSWFPCQYQDSPYDNSPGSQGYIYDHEPTVEEIQDLNEAVDEMRL